MCDCASVCASPRWPRLSRKSPRLEPPPDEPMAAHAGSDFCWGNEFRFFCCRNVLLKEGKTAWLAGWELKLNEWGTSCHLGRLTDVSHLTHERCDSFTVWTDWGSFYPPSQPWPPLYLLYHLYLTVIPLTDDYLSSPPPPVHVYKPLFFWCCLVFTTIFS